MVGIIRRNWRTRGYCGSLQPLKQARSGTASVLFVPVERKYPMIRCDSSGSVGCSYLLAHDNVQLLWQRWLLVSYQLFSN